MQADKANQIQPGAARKPPKALMKLMNPLMKAVLRSPLRGRMGDKLMVLTFSGRKSGKQFSTPVGYHREGDTIFVYTHSPWRRNFEGGAAVAMLVNGQKLRGQAETITDSEIVLKGVQDFIAKEGVKNTRMLGISLDTSHEPSEAELRQAIVGLAMVRITISRL
jgi:hypothetical protein